MSDGLFGSMFDLGKNGHWDVFGRALEYQFIDEVLMDNPNNYGNEDDD